MDALCAAEIFPVLRYLQSIRVTIPDLLSSVLVFGYCNDPSEYWYQDLISSTPSILSAFLYHPPTAPAALKWAHELMSNRHSDAIARLTNPECSWHFSATRARPDQLQDFQMEDMATQIARTEPELWSLVRTLLSGSPSPKDELPMATDGADKESGDELEDDEVEDAALWEMVGDLPREDDPSHGKHSSLPNKPKSLRKLRELQDSLRDI
uniref:Small heat shock protein n=1 Tax=Ganoderma boninense TaxID=34458 RepID=A0A5K1K319_9APHY|nr:Small heat shock protein [Ganoderma boninense]